MSNKVTSKLNPLDLLIRRTARCGMTDGTVMTINFVSGFESFNTRPYHNYETWGQGYNVQGLGVRVAKEDLDDAVQEWARLVTAKREGQTLPAHADLTVVPYKAPSLLNDWIEPSTQ